MTSWTRPWIPRLSNEKNTQNHSNSSNPPHLIQISITITQKTRHKYQTNLIQRLMISSKPNSATILISKLFLAVVTRTIGLKNPIQPVSNKRFGNCEKRITRKRAFLISKWITNKPQAHTWKIPQSSATQKKVSLRKTTSNTIPQRSRNRQAQNYHMILILCPRRMKGEKNNQAFRLSDKALKYHFKPLTLKIYLIFQA